MKLNQYEIWLADLEPHLGSEQDGKRPVLILETNGVAGKGSTTIVAPISSQIKGIYSYDVIVEPNKTNKLKEESKVMFRQIRVIDKQRLKRKLGTLEKEHWENCRIRIQYIFDIEGSYT